jgi:glycosyltransferase involved in cell wall biosynthesis
VTAPRRILYLSPSAQLGGAEHSLLDLAAGLDRQRYEPRLLCLGAGPLLGEASRRGVATELVAAPAAFARTSLRGARSAALPLLGGLLRAAPTFAAVRRAAGRTSPLLVHSNGNKTHVLSAPLTLGAAPVVWHVRDFLPARRPERLLVRIANALVGAIIANSAAVATHLAGLGARPGLVHAIPNGIDLARFGPEGPRAELRAAFGWPQQTRLVGMVGVLARWKGQEVFLRAAREIAARAPDVRFVIVGGEIYHTSGHGDFESRLRRLASELGLDGVLAFAGHRDDVPEVLRGLDVVVHASLEPEPFGRAIAESMACERPIVWARGGGADEVVGATPLAALGVPRGDPAGLAAAVERALAEPAAARRWAGEGRRRIVECFDVRQHVERVQDLYARVTADRA